MAKKQEEPVEIKIEDLNFTQEKIEELFQQSNKIAILDALLSESLRTARDRYDHVEHDFEVDGKKLKITEKECWNDFYENEEEGNSYYILKDKYKHIFEYRNKVKKLKEDMKQYMIINFGKDYSQIQFADHIRIVYGIYLVSTKKHLKIIRELKVNITNMKNEIKDMKKIIKKLK